MRRFYNDDEKPEDFEVNEDFEPSEDEIIHMISIEETINAQKLAYVMEKATDMAKQDFFWKFRSINSKLARIKKFFKLLANLMEVSISSPPSKKG